MTEYEWVKSEPSLISGLLSYLISNYDVQSTNQLFSDRKLRLIACALCRSSSEFMNNQIEHWNTIETIERIIDGEVIPAINAPRGAPGVISFRNRWITAVSWLSHPNIVDVINHVSYCLGDVVWYGYKIIYDIIGDPFRPVVREKDYLTKSECYNRINTIVHDVFSGDNNAIDALIMRECWVTPTITHLAEVAYLERVNQKCPLCHGKKIDYLIGDDNCKFCCGVGEIKTAQLDCLNMAVLADALEDIGCTNQEVMMYLRGYRRCSCNINCLSNGCYDCTDIKPIIPGWKKRSRMFWRGCWVLDLILGKS